VIVGLSFATKFSFTDTKGYAFNPSASLPD
jgi:hypothetical protein